MLLGYTARALFTYLLPYSYSSNLKPPQGCGPWDVYGPGAAKR